ncbi:hypothetical protein NST89_06510 [Caldifermentibacillus hisashii]|uniref:hypothetical protein n=1 Tax=Caldifermentibacillus hisashii TaxID=996558 RepID=UPI0031374C2B
MVIVFFSKSIIPKDGALFYFKLLFYFCNLGLYLAPTNIIEAYKSHEKDPFYSTSNKVVKDIQNQPYFKGTRKVRIGKSQPTAWIIQLTDPINPKQINEGIIHPDLPDTMIYFYVK